MNSAVSQVFVAMLHATQRMTSAATKINFRLDFCYTIHSKKPSKRHCIWFKLLGKSLRYCSSKTSDIS